MQERRQHKRFAVEHMKINGEMPLATDVKIMDLSMNGILVKADKRLNIGNKYSLKIGYKGKVLSVKVTVVRCLLVESVKDANGNVKPVYRAGMQFTDVPNEKIEEIIEFIAADTQLGCLDQILSKPDTVSFGNLSPGYMQNKFDPEHSRECLVSCLMPIFDDEGCENGR